MVTKILPRLCLFALLSCAMVALAGAQIVSSYPRLPRSQVTNLQLAMGDAAVDRSLVAFTVREGQQGHTDLNGDGDEGDEVLHVYDGRTGVTRNLALAASPDFDVSGRRVVFMVEELEQGGTDLNGDGDAIDSVFWAYDADTQTLTNLLLAGRRLSLEGQLAALLVSESQQFMKDLNGDGDTYDEVIFIRNVTTGSAFIVGLAAEVIVAGSGFVAFDVPEDDQGWTDLNGDGDTADSVVHVWVLGSGTTNLGLASNSNIFRASGSLLAFPVPEIGQGGTDLNGDGDAIDPNVLHLYDTVSKTLTNLKLDISFGPIVALSDQVAFRVREASQGGYDLNGDGDAADYVLHLYDAPSGLTINTGLAAEDDFSLTPSLLAFRVSETAQGGNDLNGDGDAIDQGVVHMRDLISGTTVNLGFESLPLLTADHGAVAFLVREAGQGATDFNGDGDAGDNVMHVHFASSGITTNLALDGNLPAFMGGVLAFVVNEGRQGGIDLNGDGDTGDNVIHQYFSSAGLIIDYGLPCEALHLGAGILAFEVLESRHGFTDLNGDLDDNDMVIHLASWR